MMSHQSKLQVVSSRKERGGLHMQSMYYYCPPPHLSFLMLPGLRRVVSRLFFFLALLPLSQVL